MNKLNTNLYIGVLIFTTFGIFVYSLFILKTSIKRVRVQKSYLSLKMGWTKYNTFDFTGLVLHVFEREWDEV